MQTERYDLIVVGGGEFARVVIDAANAQGIWNIVGFVDPQPCRETAARFNIERLGDDAALSRYPNAMCILGIGAVKVSPDRERLVARLGARRWATILHPSAVISATATIDPGAVVLPGAVICTGATIGEHSIINIGTMIDHDVHVGKFVHVAPRAALGGGCRIEENAYIGMAAAIRDHVTVGANTLVGMGAVVSKQFRDGATLIGVPAREFSKRYLDDPQNFV